jgi:hypothetical protein
VRGDGPPVDSAAPTEASARPVSLEATDAGSGVESVEYDLDDGGWTDYSAPIEATDVGEHSIDVRATDKAGNTSKPSTTTFTVVVPSGEDTTPPEVSAMVHGETDDEGAYLGVAEVMLEATDAQSEVESIKYDLDGDGWATYTDPLSITAVGDHTVKYRATDTAGNVSQPAEQELTVVQSPDDDTEAPTVSAVIDGELGADWAYVGSSAVTVTASPGPTSCRSSTTRRSARATASASR